MHKNGVMLTVACIMLCLTFNYTFPLRRESSKWNIFAIRNGTQFYCSKKDTRENVNPTKKRTVQASTEKALKIMNNASYNDSGMNKKHGKYSESRTTADDIMHFEQMVIKKKNPYLDLKELELRYYNPKNTRQSIDPGSIGLDLSLCESVEDGPNVEITNRGLSGFAIPSKLLKGANVVESKTKLETPASIDDTAIKTDAKVSKKQSDRLSSDSNLMETLKNDIREFEANKDAKMV